MHASVYTRERKRAHMINMVKVTCFALPLAAAQSLERQAHGDSRSLRRLMVAIRNKQLKQINKQYIKQCLIIKETIPKDVTHCYGQEVMRV
jgi:hypothetical protein